MLLAQTFDDAPQISVVIPGRPKGEPGIHNHEPGLWIPGLRLTAHPGMTTENVAHISRDADNVENLPRGAKAI